MKFIQQQLINLPKMLIQPLDHQKMMFRNRLKDKWAKCQFIVKVHQTRLN